MTKIKVSDFIIQYLYDQAGLRHLYLLSGGGCMHLVDSVGRHPRLGHTCCLHEQAATLAACAHAQMSGQIGAVLVTTGPGGTNALTGVAMAWTDSIPLVVLSGQVKRADLAAQYGVRFLGMQELDIISIVRPITKYAVTVTDPLAILDHLETAIFMARDQRPGPVWLDIPLDVQNAMIDPQELLAARQHTAPVWPSLPSLFWHLLAQSKRPVILAGYGIPLAGAREKFLALAEQLAIPVLTTWKALDLMAEDHPLFMGRPGMIGQRAANFIQQNCDLMIALGARLDFGQIGYNHHHFARAAKKVVVDVDPSELKKFQCPIELTINCDVDHWLEQMSIAISTSILNPADIAKNTAAWRERCQQWRQSYAPRPSRTSAFNPMTDLYHLIDALSEVTRPSDLFAPGNSGACSEVFMQHFRLQSGQRVICANGLGSMGTGLPMALGTAIAGGGRRTICVNGDGGFQMNIQELETIRRLQLPIRFFILNNGGYGSIRNMQNNYFDGRGVGADESSGVTLPPLEKIASAYRLAYFQLWERQTFEELCQQVRQILDTPGPVLCEVMISPQQPTLLRATSRIDPATGQMVSMPMEDLWPFLDRDEFYAQMMIEPLESSKSLS